MKIHIGKYKNWVGPYQIAEKLMFWVPKERDEYGFPHTAKKVHDFGTWLAEDRHGNDSWLTKVCQWFESKKKRKIKIQIDPWDTWSMDNSLSMIILPMLKQLKATKHGSPHVDDTDVPEYLHSTVAPAETEYDIDGKHHARWDWVLDEIIWAFEQLNDDDNDAQFHSGNRETLMMPVDRDGNQLGEPRPFGKSDDSIKAEFYQVVDGPNNTHVYDYEGHKKHTDRIQNGLILFGKYYRNLWD